MTFVFSYFTILSIVLGASVSGNLPFSNTVLSHSEIPESRNLVVAL